METVKAIPEEWQQEQQQERKNPQNLFFIPFLFISSSASWFAETLRQETVSTLSSEWPFSSCSLLNGATQVTISKCVSFGMHSLRFGRGTMKSSKEASFIGSSEHSF